MAQPHDPDKSEAACILYEQWNCPARVAKVLGVSRQTIRRWVIPEARETHNQSVREKRKMKYPPETVNEAKRLYAEGMKRAAIARHLKVNINTINCWVVPGAKEKKYRESAMLYAATPDREEPTANRCEADFEGLADRIEGHRKRINATCSLRRAG